MSIVIKEFNNSYLVETMNIWNEVVDEGIAFLQLDCLDEVRTAEFFTSRHIQALR